MGKLNILYHKSYHPYKAENIAKVQADEAKAKLIEEEGERRSTLAVSLSPHLGWLSLSAPQGAIASISSLSISSLASLSRARGEAVG